LTGEPLNVLDRRPRQVDELVIEKKARHRDSFSV
jgi:hypothetical protein